MSNLKQCPCCAAVIARNAPTCPHCGHVFKRQHDPYRVFFFWVLFFPFIVGLLIYFIKSIAEGI